MYVVRILCFINCILAKALWVRLEIWGANDRSSSKQNILLYLVDSLVCMTSIVRKTMVSFDSNKKLAKSLKRRRQRENEVDITVLEISLYWFGNISKWLFELPSSVLFVSLWTIYAAFQALSPETDNHGHSYALCEVSTSIITLPSSVGIKCTAIK